MVRNLLVKMREDHYLILRAVLEICDLEIDEFMDLITSNTDALARLLDHLRTSSRTESMR
jgi:hypothetical protein